MLWLLAVAVAVAAVLAYYVLNWVARSRRLRLPTSPSALWEDLDELSLAEIEVALPRRRRDPGFTVFPGNDTRVGWCDGRRERTKLCVVYIHGWSASPQENQAVAEPLAKYLGANYLCWRLSGHGAASEEGPSAGIQST